MLLSFRLKSVTVREALCLLCLCHHPKYQELEFKTCIRSTELIKYILYIKLPLS
jgi:hypothetical protein